MSALHAFLLAFVPLFWAIDPMGVLPVFVSLTEGMSPPLRRQVVRDALITAVAVSLAFLFLGEPVFRLLGVTTDDFRIAGGVLLVVFAVQDLIVGGKPRREPTPTLAVVPLGMPLIVGPGVLTTTLLVVQQQGYACTLAALALNFAIVLLTLRASDRIMRWIGAGGAVAAAKIASLFLAAIGVMMIRLGLLGVVRAAGMR